MKPDPDLLTAKEAADFLYASENSLRSMRSKRSGPPFHREGHRICYRRSELEAYLASHRPSARTQFSIRRSRSEKERGALADR